MTIKNAALHCSLASAGDIFSDGTAIEPVRDPTGALKLLAWDGKNHEITEQYTRENVAYGVPYIQPSISSSFALPSGLANFGTARELFNDVTALISSAMGGIQSTAVALSFVTFATWLSEKAAVAPFIWVVAPPTQSTSALKQVLGLLCRHALLVNALSNNWPSSLPWDLKPTLIAAVNGRPSARLLSALRESQNHGLSFARPGKPVDPFCAKVIFATESLKDPGAAGFPLEISLAMSGVYVPPFDASHAARIQKDFQNRLLAYRLANFSKAGIPDLDLRQFTPAVREMAHSLAGAVVGDGELQARLIPFLHQLNTDIHNDGVTEIVTLILEAILSRWDEDEIGVTDLTGDVNTLIGGRGGSEELTPETVGWKLKALGLRTSHIAGGVKGLKMANVRPAVRERAARYGLSIPTA